MALYIKQVNALLHHPFVSNATSKATSPDYVSLLQHNPILVGIQGDHGVVEVEVVREVEEAMDPNVLYIKHKPLTLQNL